MSEPDSKPAGVLDSLRRIGDSVLGLVQSRLQLFALELQDEKLRLVDTLLWLGAGISIGGLGLLVGTAALALYVWEQAGYAGLICLAGVLLGVGALILFRLREYLQRETPPFADTLGEFGKDRACLRKED